MSAKEEIIDYDAHHDEIEKWLALKGETKYMRFANILNANGVAVEWQVLKDTYRYDKRLLVNIFKYLSFFEEFLRAQVWKVSQIDYKKLESASLAEIIDKVVQLREQVRYIDFSVDTLSQNSELINHIRNRVSHNKIILETDKNGYSAREILSAFKETLPKAYQHGFSSDINNCANKLNVPSSLIIRLK